MGTADLSRSFRTIYQRRKAPGFLSVSAAHERAAPIYQQRQAS